LTTPVYKIETLTGAVLDHTIEDAVGFRFKEILTDGVGNFAFTVPTKKADYVYNDIALHDKVKFYVGESTVPATPNFIGRVTNIDALLNTQGYIRVISGLSQGEKLLRVNKSNKFYTGTNASVIVTEWANDLGLGTGDITADANQPDIEVRTKTYFDLMREISDYWISGANQIKKDFYVDVDFDLVWKTRPLRSGASVETFTVGDNIASYRVTEKIEPVRNDITVYGSAEKPLPQDKDSYTDSLTDWSMSVGSELVLDNANVKAGSFSVRAYTGEFADTTTFKRDIPRLTIRDINKLFFWSMCTPNIPTTSNVRLHAPDNANYFEAAFTTAGWTFNELDLGPANEYGAVTNPNGAWSLTGSPNWWDIEFIEFNVIWPSDNQFVMVDGLWFYPERWSHVELDAGSQTSYGQRDYEITDDKLHSDSACEQRAETLEDLLKDPPKQITLVTPGNSNVLVGDRLSMTIPAENISAVNFDVLSVENSFNAQQGWLTQPIMVNSGNIRKEVGYSSAQKLVELRRQVRELTLDRNVA